MEKLLDVKTKSIVRISDALSEDANAADIQADDSESEAARTRYTRMFWEPTIEHQVCLISPEVRPAPKLNILLQVPVVPQILDSVKERAIARQEAHRRVVKADQIHVLEREGRADIRFVDVGDQFVDKKTEQRRQKAIERRSSMRARRHERKLHALRTSEHGAEADA